MERLATMSSRQVGDWVVLVATRDRSHLLAACLDGLARQQLRPREIVIIDQSSNSRTEKVCSDYPVRYRTVTCSTRPNATEITCLRK